MYLFTENQSLLSASNCTNILIQNCGEDNHLTGQCKHRRKIECFHCGKSGHKDKFCSLYWSQGQKDWPSPISRASTFNLILKDIGATNVYDVNVLESIVNSGDIWSYCDITKSPADGHCILHSFITSIKNQFLNGAKLDVDYLLSAMKSELSVYADVYATNVENNDVGLLYEGFEMYASVKQYDTIFGDLVPIILCNALNVDCMLIMEDSRGIIEAEFIKSAKRGVATNKLIFLHKRGEHYNAISPKSPHVLWQFGRAQLKEKGEVSSSTPPPTSTNDGGDTIEDFLHFLKVHRKSYPTNLVTGSLNVNSLRNKFETVKYIAVNNLVDMFALCETKLDDSFPLDQFSISNFICHRKDRTSHGGGGGGGDILC